MWCAANRPPRCGRPAAGRTGARGGCVGPRTRAGTELRRRRSSTPSLGDDVDPGLVVTVEQLVGDRAGQRLVRELERRGAEPLHADDGDQTVGMHAADNAVRANVFKPHSRKQVAVAGIVTTRDEEHWGSARPDFAVPSSSRWWTQDRPCSGANDGSAVVLVPFGRPRIVPRS